MADINGFDATKVDPGQTFDLIPIDWYEGMMTDSEWKDTVAGTGKYVKMTFTLTDSRVQGRLMWENLNLVNPSEQCVQIAKGKLSAICRAVNVLTPRDTSELHNLPLLIRVGQEKREDTGEMKNVIKGYKPRVAAIAGPALSQASAPSAPMKAAVGGGAAPWTKAK